jgi:hypothetical protein
LRVFITIVDIYTHNIIIMCLFPPTQGNDEQHGATPPNTPTMGHPVSLTPSSDLSCSVATSHTSNGPPISKRPKIIKSEDDRTPLPNPFPLPKHYQADVELGLKSGKMTFETMSTFLTAVANAMLVYKLYPSSDDYICVGRSIVAKYSFMSSPAGTPYVRTRAQRV